MVFRSSSNLLQGYRYSPQPIHFIESDQVAQYSRDSFAEKIENKYYFQELSAIVHARVLRFAILNGFAH